MLPSILGSKKANQAEKGAKSSISYKHLKAMVSFHSMLSDIQSFEFLVPRYTETDEHLQNPKNEEGQAESSGSVGENADEQKGFTQAYRGVVTEVNLLKKVKIEISVNEDFVEPTIAAIIKGARTGEIGDGKIFVLDLQDSIRIRTGERGSEAIG